MLNTELKSWLIETDPLSGKYHRFIQILRVSKPISHTSFQIVCPGPEVIEKICTLLS